MSVDKDFDPIDFSHRAYEAFSKDFSKAEPYTNESSRLRLNILRFLKLNPILQKVKLLD